MEKTTKSIGDAGEEQALEYLLSEGFYLVKKNYRYKRNEIDLIVTKKDLLVFVEVKYRSSNNFGTPETSVNDKKIARIQEAAENLIYDLDWKGNIRFDIISILKNEEIKHLKDVC